MPGRCRLALQGNETILVVEDDDTVRALSRNVLKLYGYTVLEASAPRAALELTQSYPGIIDALLTDLVMPHLNGMRLSELLLSQQPQIQVLFMSGYTDDAIVRQGVLNPAVNSFQKPLRHRALRPSFAASWMRAETLQHVQNTGSRGDLPAADDLAVPLSKVHAASLL